MWSYHRCGQGGVPRYEPGIATRHEPRAASREVPPPGWGPLRGERGSVVGAGWPRLAPTPPHEGCSAPTKTLAAGGMPRGEHATITIVPRSLLDDAVTLAAPERAG